MQKNGPISWKERKLSLRISDFCRAITDVVWLESFSPSNSQGANVSRKKKSSLIIQYFLLNRNIGIQQVRERESTLAKYLTFLQKFLIRVEHRKTQ